jgi:hypothetical protein
VETGTRFHYQPSAQQEIVAAGRYDAALGIGAMTRFKIRADCTVESKSKEEAQSSLSNALSSLGQKLVTVLYDGTLPVKQPSPWQPIKTAPKKEGRKILGLDAATGIAETATYSEPLRSWIWSGTSEGPTHWMEQPDLD